MTSVQWFERTLDYGAIRSVTLPEAFLATEIVLTTLQNVSEGLVMYPRVIAQELPFIMALIKKGRDRQREEKIRIVIRCCRMKLQAKQLGDKNDLIQRKRKDA